jgi:hypothetical protein
MTALLCLPGRGCGLAHPICLHLETPRAGAEMATQAVQLLHPMSCHTATLVGPKCMRSPLRSPDPHGDRCGFVVARV